MRSLSAQELWGCQSKPLQTTSNTLMADEVASVDGFVTFLGRTDHHVHVCVGVRVFLVWKHTFTMTPLLLLTRVLAVVVLCMICARPPKEQPAMSLIMRAYSLCMCVPLHLCQTTTYISDTFSSAIPWKLCRFVGVWVYEQVCADMLIAHVASPALTTGQCRRLD